MKFLVSSEDIDGWLYTLFLLLITTFFFLDPFSYTPKAVVVVASWYLMALIALRRPFRPHPVLILLGAFLMLLQFSRFYDSSKFTVTESIYPWGVLYAVFLCYFLEEQPEIVRKAVGRYISIFVVLALPSILIQLAILLNVALPYTLIHLGGRAENLYRNYYNLAVFFDHQVLEFGNFTVVRLQGMFEEPGMLGTDCGILLAANTILFPERKWTSRALMLLGLLSASFAFYIFALAYSVHFFIQHKLRKFLLAIPLVFLLVLAVPQDIRDAFDSIIITRFMLTDEGVFKGDTGYIDYAEKYSEYLSTASVAELTFGHGSKSNQTDVKAQYGTYQSVVYEGGFIGLGLMVLFCGYLLLWLPLRQRKYSLCLVTGTCLMFLYHRPDFLSAQYCILYAVVVLAWERATAADYRFRMILPSSPAQQLE